MQTAVRAQQLDREMRANVRATGKRSREAFSEMMQSVAKKCKTSDEQADVVANLLSYSKVRRQLARHRAQRCTPVADPLNLRRIQREGLKPAYEVDQSPVREWLRRIMVVACIWTYVRFLLQLSLYIRDAIILLLIRV